MGRRKGPPLTRQQVVHAAIAIVQDEGPDALGVSRVARKLGIRPPSIYNHVQSGEALTRATVFEANRLLLHALEAAVIELSEPREQLRALALATRRWALENAGLYTLMARVEPDNEHPEFAPTLKATFELFAQPMAELGVPAGARIHALRALRSSVHGFLLLETSGQFQLPEDLEASYRWLVEAMIRGVSIPPV